MKYFLIILILFFSVNIPFGFSIEGSPLAPPSGLSEFKTPDNPYDKSKNIPKGFIKFKHQVRGYYKINIPIPSDDGFLSGNISCQVYYNPKDKKLYYLQKSGPIEYDLAGDWPLIDEIKKGRYNIPADKIDLSPKTPKVTSKPAVSPAPNSIPKNFIGLKWRRKGHKTDLVDYYYYVGQDEYEQITQKSAGGGEKFKLRIYYNKDDKKLYAYDNDRLIALGPENSSSYWNAREILQNRLEHNLGKNVIILPPAPEPTPDPEGFVQLFKKGSGVKRGTTFPYETYVKIGRKEKLVKFYYNKGDNKLYVLDDDDKYIVLTPKNYKGYWSLRKSIEHSKFNLDPNTIVKPTPVPTPIPIIPKSYEYTSPLQQRRYKLKRDRILALGIASTIKPLPDFAEKLNKLTLTEKVNADFKYTPMVFLPVRRKSTWFADEFREQKQVYVLNGEVILGTDYSKVKGAVKRNVYYNQIDGKLYFFENGKPIRIKEGPQWQKKKYTQFFDLSEDIFNGKTNLPEQTQVGRMPKSSENFPFLKRFEKSTPKMCIKSDGRVSEMTEEAIIGLCTKQARSFREQYNKKHESLLNKIKELDLMSDALISIKSMAKKNNQYKKYCTTMDEAIKIEKHLTKYNSDFGCRLFPIPKVLKKPEPKQKERGPISKDDPENQDQTYLSRLCSNKNTRKKSYEKLDCVTDRSNPLCIKKPIHHEPLYLQSLCTDKHRRAELYDRLRCAKDVLERAIVVHDGMRDKYCINRLDKIDLKIVDQVITSKGAQPTDVFCLSAIAQQKASIAEIEKLWKKGGWGALTGDSNYFAVMDGKSPFREILSVRRPALAAACRRTYCTKHEDDKHKKIIPHDLPPFIFFGDISFKTMSVADSEADIKQLENFNKHYKSVMGLSKVLWDIYSGISHLVGCIELIKPPHGLTENPASFKPGSVANLGMRTFETVKDTSNLLSGFSSCLQLVPDAMKVLPLIFKSGRFLTGIFDKKLPDSVDRFEEELKKYTAAYSDAITGGASALDALTVLDGEDFKKNLQGSYTKLKQAAGKNISSSERETMKKWVKEFDQMGEDKPPKDIKGMALHYSKKMIPKLITGGAPSSFMDVIGLLEDYLNDLRKQLNTELVKEIEQNTFNIQQMTKSNRELSSAILKMTERSNRLKWMKKQIDNHLADFKKACDKLAIIHNKFKDVVGNIPECHSAYECFLTEMEPPSYKYNPWNIQELEENWSRNSCLP